MIKEFLEVNKYALLITILELYFVIDVYYQSTKDDNKSFKDNLINALKHLFRNAKQKFLEE
jgi:hypothetical protein